MLFTSRYWIFALSIASLSNALPLDAALKPRNLVQRAKSYSVVNVDGGSTVPSDTPTTVLETTTAIVTSKATSSTPTSTSTPSSTPAKKQPSSQASPKPTSTPKPSVVTVIITETVSPTEFYDDGMWHTLYPVKTFEQVVATTTASSSSTSFVPTESSSTNAYY